MARLGTIIALSLSVWLLQPVASAGEVGYYTQPALHGSRVVFASEGDLFTADLSKPASPIIAHRLTSHEGIEGRPVISADGSTIAFTGEYDGNSDVYIMPIDGGAPKRLTFHPGMDMALGFTPNGREVLFRSGRTHHFGRPELWKVSINGGMPERFDFGECSMAALNRSGKVIAFTRWSNEYWSWKHYRGGQAPEIWVGEFASNKFQNLTHDDANDLFPMWIGNRIYFLSDRDGQPNIWSDSPRGNDVKQHTHFAFDEDEPANEEGYDIRWPSADAATGIEGSGRIVFAQGGGLAILDTADGSVQRLSIELASDRIGARERFADDNRDITEFSLSPDGTKLLAVVRGEILEGETTTKRMRRLTHTAGARERGPVYLDNDRIAYITDKPGEQQIAVRLSSGEERLLTADRKDWLMSPVVSPDGQRIAFGDKTDRLHVLDVATAHRDIADRSDAWEITDYRFSPDSQWLAYVKDMPNGFGRIYLYSPRTRRSFPVSYGLHDEASPRWDPKGKYLYCLARTEMNPLLGDIDTEYVLKNTWRVFAISLSSETPPPDPDIARVAGFDLEAWADADDPTGTNEFPVAADQPEGTRGPMRLDTDGLVQRWYMLPIEAGNYTNIEAIHGSVLVLSEPNEGLLEETPPLSSAGVGSGQIVQFNLVEQESSVFAENVSVFTVSRDRSTIGYPVSEGVMVRGIGSDRSVTFDPDDVPLDIDTEAEWSAILDEAWRLERDFYWAPNMGGINWQAMREKYRALLSRIATRNELNDLIGEMIGELRTSHTYVWGGDIRESADAVNVGMLGADIEYRNGAFRITRILPTQSWDEDLRSPLAAAHLGISDGYVIHAINGSPLVRGMNIHNVLQGQAERWITLEFSEDGVGERRTISVQTIADDGPLRYAAWVEDNRRKVDEASGGALGYLHIPDMGGDGLSAFSRLYYPQIDKRGLVIDIRNNRGGFVSQMIIERIARKVWAFMQPRHGATTRFPEKAMYGHMVVLIDQHAGSDGDIFPESFRLKQLGPLIGTRTWGGVVGIRTDKPFVDSGVSSQPEFAWWEPVGGWSLENRGVEPDIPVDITPRDRQLGTDTQLDKAIEVLLGKLADEPMNLPVKPEFPKK